MIYIVISSVDVATEDSREFYKLMLGAFTDINVANKVAKDNGGAVYPIREDEILRPFPKNFTSPKSKEEFKKNKEKLAGGEYQRVVYHHIYY